MGARGKDEIERLIEDGLALYGKGDFDGALEIWETALSEDPDNEQANSYVDYVRMHYDVLTGADPGTDSDLGDLGYGIADDEEPEYQIEILPGQAESPEGPPPLYMDPLDEGWFIDDRSEANVPALKLAVTEAVSEANAAAIEPSESSIATLATLASAAAQAEADADTPVPQPFPQPSLAGVVSGFVESGPIEIVMEADEPNDGLGAGPGDGQGEGVGFDDATNEYPPASRRPAVSTGEFLSAVESKPVARAKSEPKSDELSFADPTGENPGFGSQVTDVKPRALGFVQPAQSALAAAATAAAVAEINALEPEIEIVTPTPPVMEPEIVLVRPRRASGPPGVTITVRTPTGESAPLVRPTEMPDTSGVPTSANDMPTWPGPAASGTTAAATDASRVTRARVSTPPVAMTPALAATLADVMAGVDDAISAPVAVAPAAAAVAPPEPELEPAPAPEPPALEPIAAPAAVDLPSTTSSPTLDLSKVAAAALAEASAAEPQPTPPFTSSTPTLELTRTEFADAIGDRTRELLAARAETRDLERTPTTRLPIHSGSTEDPLVSAPTRELGMRPPAVSRSSSEDEPTGVRQTVQSMRTIDGVDFALLPDGTRADVVLPFDPIDARSAQILDDVDDGAPASESREDRTRRRITALLDRAAEWNRAGEHDRAVAAVDLALSEDPSSALAQKLVHRNREAIMGAFQIYLGDLERQPALARPLHELAASPISSRAAFLLSRIDGALTLEEILDVSGMPRLEAYRYLCQLFLRGILR